jgi:hypothetical protein
LKHIEPRHGVDQPGGSPITDTLPTIDNLEVLNADADDPDAASIIIATG